MNIQQSLSHQFIDKTSKFLRLESLDSSFFFLSPSKYVVVDTLVLNVLFQVKMEADVRSHLSFTSTTDSAYLDNNNNNTMNTTIASVNIANNNSNNMSFGLPTSRYLQPRKSNESSMSTISGNSNSSNEKIDTEMHALVDTSAAKSTLCCGGGFGADVSATVTD